LDEVPAGVDLERQDLGLLAVGQLEQVVGQRDALAAGALVDDEAGLGGLAAAADVEGVDDVGEAGRTVASASCSASRSPRLRDRQASRNWLWGDVLWRSSTCRCSQRAAA
jgi:hypothetical protein